MEDIRGHLKEIGWITMEFSEKKRAQLESKLLSYRFRVKDANQRKTYDDVFDEITLLTLYDLMSSGVIDTLDFPIATGKEGNVFRANTADGNMLAVKIYRVSNSTFKNIQKYVVGDKRFKNVGRNHRRAIILWAQKEYRNLERMTEGGISVPKPVACRKNVVVMEYIGTEEVPAQHLREAQLKNPDKIFKTLKKEIKTMYQDVGLVHSDFSEYNILLRNSAPVIIDVGQAVLKGHPMAETFLERDVANLIRYFNKLGVKATADEVLKEIRGEE
jgi:RIO kinase 1